MRKNVKRFISISLVAVLCLLMSTVAMAAENESDKAQCAFEDILSPYATNVGSCVFSLNNFGNTSGTALKSQGSQWVACKSGPTSLSYVALPQSGSGTVYIRFKNNNSTVELKADGKTHTTSIVSNGLQYTTNIEVEYYGASTPLVSISLVFSK